MGLRLEGAGCRSRAKDLGSSFGDIACGCMVK